MRLSGHHERRASPRCDAVKNQSRLEFSVPGGSRRVEARLINLSPDGASIVAEEPPPCGSPLWIRIESPVKTEWIKAAAVRVGQGQEFAVHFPTAMPGRLPYGGDNGPRLESHAQGWGHLGDCR